MRPAQRGMTLIEIMVTLAVVGLAMYLGYMAVRRVSKSDLRENAGQIAATLKNGYRMAAVSGLHHRVVIDLKEQSFRIETCQGKVALRKSEREELPDEKDDGFEPYVDPMTAQMLAAVSAEEATKIAAAIEGSKVGDAKCALSTLPNGDSDGRANVRQLDVGRDITFKRVFVQHLDDAQMSGIVTINFFPLGYAEKAIVEVGNDDGDRFSILVHGLTGRVEMRDGELSDPNDHMMRDASGERTEER
jgi:prepilin-type N-terminal cleavage/methylation domain-containing protein